MMYARVLELQWVMWTFLTVSMLRLAVPQVEKWAENHCFEIFAF